MLHAQNKSLGIKRSGLWVAGLFLLSGFILGCNNKTGPSGNPKPVGVAAVPGNRKPADTPVILIGDSMRFKAGAQTPGGAWTETDPNTVYTMQLTSPITTVALEQNSKGDDNDNSNPGDNDSTNDAVNLTDSNVTLWTIDVFTVPPSDTATPSVSLSVTNGTAVAPTTTITVTRKDTNGKLCKESLQRVEFSPDSCKKDGTAHTRPKFDHVNVTVTKASSVQWSATYTCLDQNKQKGKCRIVLRQPPTP